MLLGYARVSTTDQDPALQLRALKKAGCKRIFEEQASGAKIDRPELARILDVVRAGDTIVIWKLDRLARSIAQLIETVRLLEDKKVQLRSLTESIDTSTAGGKLTFHIFGALAEFERALIQERTMAGLAAARAQGRYGGRPRVLDENDIKTAKALIAAGESMDDVARRLGVARSTLYAAGLRKHPSPPPKPRRRKRQR